MGTVFLYINSWLLSFVMSSIQYFGTLICLLSSRWKQNLGFNYYFFDLAKCYFLALMAAIGGDGIISLYFRGLHTNFLCGHLWGLRFDYRRGQYRKLTILKILFPSSIPGRPMQKGLGVCGILTVVVFISIIQVVPCPIIIHLYHGINWFHCVSESASHYQGASARR